MGGLLALSGALVFGCTPREGGSSVSPQRAGGNETSKSSGSISSPPHGASSSLTGASSAAGDSAPPPATSTAPAGSMEDRIKQSFVIANAKAADSWPEKGPSGAFRSPGGHPISKVFVIGYSRPREADGWPYTAYVCEVEKQYWVHEGGGISGIDRWYGPVALP